jgi:hypothetical protein
MSDPPEHGSFLSEGELTSSSCTPVPRAQHMISLPHSLSLFFFFVVLLHVLKDGIISLQDAEVTQFNNDSDTAAVPDPISYRKLTLTFPTSKQPYLIDNKGLLHMLEVILCGVML